MISSTRLMKFRAQEFGQGLHGLVTSLLGRRAAEADGAALPVGARIGRHNDDGVFKIHDAALRIGDAAVIQNLKQNIQYVRVSLFQLVEQNDGIGLAADLFRQLARLVIADIAGGRADELRDGVASPCIPTYPAG